ncbi:MAG: hypothetical protein AAGH19_05230 [Pseudomonadota bacterium]
MMTRLLFLATAVSLSGCAATTTIDEFRPTDQLMDLAAGEKVVVLGRRDAGHYETDRAFVECVGDKLRGPNINLMSEQEFMDSIYPWFEPRTAPKNLTRLTRLMEVPMVRERIDEREIRYIVWLDGNTETGGAMGSMSCSFSPAGGGCLGFTQWDKESAYEAVVWDLKDLTEKGRVRVDSEGTSYVIGVVAPIPLLSPVKSNACSGLGNQLRSYFSQELG